MTNEEYQNLQKDGSSWSYNSGWGDQMEDAILNWFAKDLPKDSTIIDIGCGEGRGVKALLDNGFLNVSGIDLTSEKLNVGKLKGLNLIEGDLHDLSNIKDKSYEYGFCSHTLEHMINIKEVIKNLLRVISKKLYYIIPIHESKEFVQIHNPSHISPIKYSKEFTDILDELGLKHESFEKIRLSDELWGIISLE